MNDRSLFTKSVLTTNQRIDNLLISDRSIDYSAKLCPKSPAGQFTVHLTPTLERNRQKNSLYIGRPPYVQKLTILYQSAMIELVIIKFRLSTTPGPTRGYKLSNKPLATSVHCSLTVACLTQSNKETYGPKSQHRYIRTHISARPRHAHNQNDRAQNSGRHAQYRSP